MQQSMVKVRLEQNILVLICYQVQTVQEASYTSIWADELI